jgi:transcriptional regulator with XRE-family HTH domain
MIELNIKNYKQKFASAVKRKREEQGISQEELGNKAGLTSKTIHRIENLQFNDIKYTTIEAVCKALGYKRVKLIIEE